MTAAWLRDRLASGAWLDEARLRRWAGLMLAAQIVIGLGLAAGAHGLIVRLHGAGTTDFVSFYAAGTVAAGPTPEAVYDRAVHYAAERAATDPRIDYIYFFYPPVFLLLCRALAALPYLAAFYCFAALTLAFYLGVLRAVLGKLPRWWLLPALGFSPVLWNFGFGQNAALTAGLFGAGCLLLQRGCPWRAGLVLGLLIYKPHTGLLLPVALLMGCQMRAVLGAAASVICAIGASIAAFGWAPWPAFGRTLMQSGRDFSAGGITPFSNMVNLAGALRDHGVGADAAGMAQSAVALVAAGCVGWAWYGGQPGARGAGGRPGAAAIAVLIASAIVAMPVVLFYDLLLPSMAAAFIIAEGRRTGFLAYEKSVLAGCWLAASLAYPLSRAGHVPIGLIGCLAILGLALRRYRARSDLLHSFLCTVRQACPANAGTAGTASQNGVAGRVSPLRTGEPSFMRDYIRNWVALKTDNRGVTALEYAIIAGVLGLGLVGIFGTFKTSLSTLFTSVGGDL